VKDLPIAARLFVGAVLAAGALTLVVFAPHAIANPLLFALLLGGSSLASALKVSLPLASSSGSTMSVSYAVDLAALLLLGADETMLVAATSTWSQCTFQTQPRSVPYRTLCSMASVVLTVKATGWIYTLLGGVTLTEAFSLVSIPRPLVGAATTYFVFNTLFIATAIGLSPGSRSRACGEFSVEHAGATRRRRRRGVRGDHRPRRHWMALLLAAGELTYHTPGYTWAGSARISSGIARVSDCRATIESSWRSPSTRRIRLRRAPSAARCTPQGSPALACETIRA
jgi:hypothetical protein